MKKLVVKSLILVFLFIGFGSMSGSAFPVYVHETEFLQDTKKEIKVEDIPDAVKETFDSDYGDLSIEKAYEITTDSGSNYDLIVTINEQKWALRFDERGSYLEKNKASE